MTVDFLKGKLYKITNNVNNIIYVGSTCQSLNKRLSSHRTTSKQLHKTSSFYVAMRLVGAFNFQIELIKDFPCTNKQELWEQEYLCTNKYIDDGIKVYNMQINGKHSIQTNLQGAKARTGLQMSIAHKQNLSAALKGLRKTDAFRKHLSAVKTDRGSLHFHKKGQSWVFKWCPTIGKQESRSFAVGRWDQAILKAQAKQNEIYPQ